VEADKTTWNKCYNFSNYLA